MRLAPRSLFGRLLAIAGLSTLVALAVAGFGIGHVLERFVMRGLDDRLDAQVAVLAQAVRPDGRLDAARVVDLPGFGERGSDWTWRVRTPRGTWRSVGGAGAIPLPAAPPPPEGALRPGDGPPRRHGPHPGPRPDAPRPGEGVGADGHRLHIRTLTMPAAGGVATITAAGPRRFVAAPLREAMVPLLASLGLLGLALAGATAVQLRVGLAPLGRLQAALAGVIAGTRTHVPADQPAELAPLAAELNALIDQNAAGLAHARRHVANLAHGLKTPLAALSLRLGEGGRDPDGSLAAMLAAIDAQVGHHLRRARAAAPGGTGRAATPLAPALDDLVAVLRRIHADRGIAVALDVAPGLAVAVEAQDLDEMIGNLLDNGWRHARARIAVTARAAGNMVAIGIEDDGAGLAPGERAAALLPGRRLDERGPGHGFGLPITQELAELNGGDLRLAAGGLLPGLRAELSLPAAPLA